MAHIFTTMVQVIAKIREFLKDYIRKDEIKTINGESLIGPGDIQISGGGGGGFRIIYLNYNTPEFRSIYDIISYIVEGFSFEDLSVGDMFIPKYSIVYFKAQIVGRGTSENNLLFFVETNNLGRDFETDSGIYIDQDDPEYKGLGFVTFELQPNGEVRMGSISRSRIKRLGI